MRGIIRAMAAMTLLAPFALDAQGTSIRPQSASPDSASWFEYTVPTPIVGKLYYVGTRGLAAYLIESDSGLILINGAMPASAHLIERSIRELGFHLEEVRILLATHAHAPQVGSHAYIKSRSRAQIAIMEGDVELFESGGRAGSHYQRDSTDYYEPAKVDRVLHDGDTVRLGGVTLVALRTGGHTAGATTWVLSMPDSGRTYRVAIVDGTEIDPDDRLAAHPSYPHIADMYMTAIPRLAEIQPDIWLSTRPGVFNYHFKRAQAVIWGRQAWLDQPGYDRFLSEHRARLDSVLAKQREGDGLPDGAWRVAGADTGMSVTFDYNGIVLLRLQCHRAGGQWSLGGRNEIVLERVTLTIGGCPPSPAAEKLIADWPTLTIFHASGGRLRLESATGVVYQLERKP
jgi:metallo-beta-lactamase class B